MAALFNPSAYLWFVVGQLYLDFWVDHPLWLGDYSDTVLDNVYHHYVQTKDHGHWIFKGAMQVTMTVQLLYLVHQFWNRRRVVDLVSLGCNAMAGWVFLTLILPHRDGMAAVGKDYRDDDRRRAEFVACMNCLANAHVFSLVLCAGGILADYFAGHLPIIDDEYNHKKLKQQ